MKRPVVPVYNVQLKAIKAYIAGNVSLRGNPAVHVRLGEHTHVIDADSVILLAESMIEQAKVAQQMAAFWVAALKSSTEDRQAEIEATK